MDHTAPATLLKVLVEQRRWRYRDFLAAFQQAANELHRQGAGTRNLSVSEAQFRRWTAGKVSTLPAPEACQVLEFLFGVPAAQLFGPPPSAALSAQPSPTFDLEEEIAVTARDAQEQAGAAAAESVSDTTLDQLRDDVTALARRYGQTSPFDAFRTAKLLREQAEHLRDRTQVPAQQQDLLIIAGEACALLATAAFDLGSLDNAARLTRSAALYGETARFEPLRAFAGGVLAYISYFSGRPSDAVRFARAARGFGGVGDVARRRLSAIEARAFGHLGDRPSAQRALRSSQEEGRGEIDELHDTIGGEFSFSEERLAMSNASTSLLLADGPAAEEFAERALHLISTRPAARRSAQVVGGAASDLAIARLLRGDLSGAEDALQALWEVPREQRATGLLERTGILRRALTAPRYQGAQLAIELGNRLEDFSRVALPRQLGTGTVAALEG
jgi:hypothetical protein